MFYNKCKIPSLQGVEYSVYSAKWCTSNFVKHDKGNLKKIYIFIYYRLLAISDHAAIFLTPEYKKRLAQEPPVKRVVTCWFSHSEAMLQAALNDVDWDMFRASSSDVSEFMDVALSFVNMLTEQATETVTIRTSSNQKPWVDRTILVAVNPHCRIQRWSSIGKHERVQSIVLNSETGRELSLIFS